MRDEARCDMLSSEGVSFREQRWTRGEDVRDESHAHLGGGTRRRDSRRGLMSASTALPSTIPSSVGYPQSSRGLGE